MISRAALMSLLIILCSLLCSTQAVTPRTMVSLDSYLVYPQWLPSPQRILRLTFRTSELNGVLVYSEGCDRPDYLMVQLLNGSLVARLSLREGEVTESELGDLLNDNQPHQLTVYHDPPNLQFRYVLDGGSPVEEGYPSDLIPAFGSGGVFIGGIPPDVTAENHTSFVGCLDAVLFGTGSIPTATVESLTLQSPQPLQTGGVVRDGCPDPCSSVNCGEGRCVARWPDRAFCDCSDAGLLGEFCTEGETIIL